MLWLEAASYVVTVIGLPVAIVVFLYEQRQQRENEEEALYQSLSDEYKQFLRLTLEHADLRLTGPFEPARELDEDQRERKRVLFTILVSLFERAYIVLHETAPTAHEARLWRSWEDYMREWCVRPDFRAALPVMLEGEDDEFSTYILRLVAVAESAHAAR